MTYEPRGKVATLLEAMRKEPSRIWTSPEVCKVMGVQQAAVTAYVDTAIRNGTLYRRTEGGRCQYALKPFSAPDAATVTAPRETPTWKPPQMVPPRGTPAPTEAPLPAPPVASVPPAIAPAPAEASITEGVAAEEEEQQVTWSLWEDGDLDLHGLQELEDGSHRLPAEALARLRKFISWMPA